jgi:threonylcarbamoyladenosine tRNA methylthiotransferase MtaB
MPPCSPAEPMNPVEIVTFGCRLNAFESEAMRRLADGAGLENVVIVNTCAVTAEAERQARQAIRRARREHPEARIIVTGCAATLAPERYAALAEVDLVLDNQAKLQAESYALAPHPNPLPAGGEREPAVPRPNRPPPPQAGEGGGGGATDEDASPRPLRARAYLQVQQGCDHRCTFCIIPYARGPSRSVPFAAIVADARRLVAEGVREIVLTGVDLTA